MVILENIDIDIDIDKAILQNIDIESIQIWHIEQGYAGPKNIGGLNATLRKSTARISNLVSTTSCAPRFCYNEQWTS